MNRDIIINIINGYENQLLNTNDPKHIVWLRDQISEAHKVLATQSVF